MVLVVLQPLLEVTAVALLVLPPLLEVGVVAVVVTMAVSVFVRIVVAAAFQRQASRH